ncbi:MAG: Do family serine endopeptidase [Alphaproteobacteria bacterium]|nr:Do family serine endopeptidase [Alphaproteobacteria bacterium]
MKFLKKKFKIIIAVILVIVIAGLILAYFDNISGMFKPQSKSTPVSTLDTPVNAEAKSANLGDNYKAYDKPIGKEGFADLVEFVNPAIVNISAIKVVKTQNMDIPVDAMDPAFKEFFKNILPDEPKEQRFMSLGSGFVVRSDGFVVTNNHVVDGAEKVQVNFSDGRKLDAQIYAIDKITDIALLKVDATDLKTLGFGDSDKVRVGDLVIAVGNPFGLGGTVSSGIVSAIGRDIQIGPYNDFIQTDAAINKGNSGGPMINTKGEVIGINTAIFSTQGGGSIGIGFAVPSNVIQNIVSQLLVDKRVTRGWLGVQVQAIDENMSKTLGLKEANGALISNIVKGGPAERAGLKSGDVILSVNGETLKNSRTLPRIISNIKPGTEITLGIISNKVKKDVKITIEEIPENMQQAQSSSPEELSTKNNKIKEMTFDDIGLKVVEINPAVRAYFKMDDSVNGVVILGVKTSSIAKQKNLSAGLIIVSVNQEEIKTLDQLKTAIDKNREGGLLILVEDRDKNRLFVSITQREIETGFPEN